MKRTDNPNRGKRSAARLPGSGSRPSEHTSVCVSYRMDDNGNKVDGKIITRPKPTASERIRQARKVVEQRDATKLALLSMAGNNSECD